MKHCMTTLLISLFFLACSGDDDNALKVCGVDRPTEQLAWLSQEIEEREQNGTEDTKYCYITQGKWNDQPVFIYYDCNPVINKVFPVFDCEGETLGSLGTGIPFDEISEECTIWLPQDFACLVDFACVKEGVFD